MRKSIESPFPRSKKLTDKLMVLIMWALEFDYQLISSWDSMEYYPNTLNSELVALQKRIAVDTIIHDQHD